MSAPNSLLGTLLHAVGGISAASCYLPSTKTKGWSWNTFWLAQSVFAWFLVPLLLAWLTVPNFFSIIAEAPSKPLWMAFLLGGIYGFGGMSFGKAINHIGYSLTYTLAIGISAVVGTVMPLMVFGGLEDFFTKPGGCIVLLGMALSIVGVVICGWAGFKKEKDINAENLNKAGFNMMLGLILSIIAGVLSGVFNLSLEYGQPVADMAAENGAGNFEGNAKLVVSTMGCFVVNVVWYIIASVKQKTIREFLPNKNNKKTKRPLYKNWLLSSLAGTLWCLQFFFYGLGHVKMGEYKFASWVLHMSMLIFFSYIVGVIMKEWNNVKKGTYALLIIGLVILIVSFCVTSYGSS